MNKYPQRPTDRLGATKSSTRWITKTDLSRYFRCPRAFWLIDTRQARASEVFAEIGEFRQLGIDFERRVRSESAVLRADSPTDVAAAVRSADFFDVGHLEHPGLGLRGRPDGVATRGDAVIPVEIKRHFDPTPLDELELCFYWELVAHWWNSTRGPMTTGEPPMGRLILPDRQGGYRIEDRKLTDRKLDAMHRLISEIRNVRERPELEPECMCGTCDTPRWALTRIAGIKRPRALALQAAGIATVASLLEKPPEVLAAAFEGHKGRPSITEVTRWRHHARAIESRKLVVFSPEQLAFTDFLAVDLEYCTDPGDQHIYLLGTCIVREGARTSTSRWADPGQETDLLAALWEVLKGHPDLTVVTWSGESADHSQLKRACDQLNRPDLLNELAGRHFDLYAYVERCIRFPVGGLGLKETYAYLEGESYVEGFGAKSTENTLTGRRTASMWKEYCRYFDTPTAAGLREALTAYNSDDVRKLVGITEALQRRPWSQD